MEHEYPQNTFTVTSLGVAEFDHQAADQVSRERQSARILVADYARHHGLRDPNDIARFANECVQNADEWIVRQDAGDASHTLSGVAVRIAARRIGLLSKPEPRKSASPTDWVPRGCERQMPPQPLGELVTPASPTFWRQVFTQMMAFVTVAWSKIGLG
jgi:hypothetical protein